jgi:hypothetical protein
MADLRCSFCGKGQDDVQKLVAGPGIYICDECVALCSEIIAEEGIKSSEEVNVLHELAYAKLHRLQETFRLTDSELDDFIERGAIPSLKLGTIHLETSPLKAAYFDPSFEVVNLIFGDADRPQLHMSFKLSQLDFILGQLRKNLVPWLTLKRIIK